MELGAVDKALGEKSHSLGEGLADAAAQGILVRGGQAEVRLRNTSWGMFSASHSCEITEMRIRKSGYLRIEILAFKLFLAPNRCTQSTAEEVGAPWGNRQS